MRVLGIVQARLGSTRLPGKVLADIEGRSLLQHLIERSWRSRHLGEIVVATTEEAEDDRLADYVKDVLGIDLYRGSTDDVLARFHGCASPRQPNIIVRLTADDPLKDATVIDRAVDALLEDEALDYCSNTLTPTFPEGLDVEAFRWCALDRAHREARLASEREHVTPYIWKHPDRFRVCNFEHDEDLSGWRLTVDKPADLELMRVIFRALGRQSNLFGYRELIAYLKAHPAVRAINDGTQRNEGYQRSIEGESQ